LLRADGFKVGGGGGRMDLRSVAGITGLPNVWWENLV